MSGLNYKMYTKSAFLYDLAGTFRHWILWLSVEVVLYSDIAPHHIRNAFQNVVPNLKQARICLDYSWIHVCVHTKIDCPLSGSWL